jgi:hypothetical protein
MHAHLAHGIRLFAVLALVQIVPICFPSVSQAGGPGRGGNGNGGNGNGGNSGIGGMSSRSHNNGPSQQNFAKPFTGSGMNQNATRSIQSNNSKPFQHLGNGQLNKSGHNSQQHLPAIKNISSNKISGFPQHHNQHGQNSNNNVLSKKVGGIHLGNQGQHNVQKHLGGIQDKMKSLPHANHSNHSQHQNGNNHGQKINNLLGQSNKHFKMPDHWHGSGKGPIKIHTNHDKHDHHHHHCLPQHKDCHGHSHKHFCHYDHGFNAWWYKGPSYCNVVAVPAQPLVQVVGVAQQPAGPPQMILIANLPENGVEVAYLVNGSVVRTAPGSAEPISAPTAEVAYDRGGGFGPANVSLDAGTYEFHRTAEGWQLVRKTFRIAIENRGALDVFRFQADGKPVELPAGTQMQFESNFPMTITFEQNGQPASRQLADGLFMVGPGESGLLDILAVTE